MAVEVPYVTTPGSIVKILEKIKEAATPEIFSQDFLKTKLGFNGGNYLSFIPWAKKVGLLNNDGSPTLLYKQFRNPSTSGISLATVLRNGYKELYSRNEYCHDLDRKAFKGLVVEATGDGHDSGKVERIVSTFCNAKTLADFENSSPNQKENLATDVRREIEPEQTQKIEKHIEKKLNLGLNYTINLVLPKTDDPSVYNAIFKSLKDNLLND